MTVLRVEKMTEGESIDTLENPFLILRKKK